MLRVPRHADSALAPRCRDWARVETAMGIIEVIKQHAAGSGIAYLREQQLLTTPVPSAAG